MKKKYNSVNWLRFIACFFVINTHISCLYPSKLSSLAFGGYFGNCIFFFVSGFCLAHPKENIFKWYGHRFIRIYISYFLFLPILFFAGQLSDLPWYEIIMPFKQYHFIPTILALYPVFYLLSFIAEKTVFSLKKIAAFLFIIQLIQYLFIFDYNNLSVLTHFTFPETTSYLFIMLIGAIMKDAQIDTSKTTIIRYVSLLIFSLFIYIFQSIKPFTGILSLLQIYIGLAFSISICLLALNIEDKLPKIKFIDTVSALTLESYLVQFISRDAFKMTNFPVGLIYHIISTIAVAYCLHIVSNWCLRKIERK